MQTCSATVRQTYQLYIIIQCLYITVGLCTLNQVDP
jgi:hypothetical protein